MSVHIRHFVTLYWNRVSEVVLVIYFIKKYGIVLPMRQSFFFLAMMESSVLPMG